MTDQEQGVPVGGVYNFEEAKRQEVDGRSRITYQDVEASDGGFWEFKAK